MSLKGGLIGVLVHLSLITVAYGHDASGLLKVNEAKCEKALQPEIDWGGRRVILDANVLLTDPMHLHKFPKAEIVLSMAVLDAIDAVKDDQRLAQASKDFSKELLNLMGKSTDKRRIALPNGATLVIEPDHKQDVLALALAKGGGASTVIVTDNFNMRVRADLAGVATRAPVLDGTESNYRRRDQFIEAQLSKAELDAFTRDNRIAKPESLNIRPNEFVKFSAPGQAGSDLTVGRYVYDRTNPSNSHIKRIVGVPEAEMFGYAPRNIEQAMAQDVAVDPSVDCVILEAKAGTGKTLLAVVAAMYLRGRNLVKEVLVSRAPVFVNGYDTGWLPGGIVEKHEQWVQPFLDNLKALGTIKSKSGHKSSPTYTESLPNGWSIIPFGNLRGRSLSRAFIILDEFQNTDVHGAKTALTRVADSKVLLMGDVTQIDSPNLNANNNGLAASIAVLRSRHFSDAQLSRVAVVHMYEGQRGDFAEMAADGFNRPLPND